MCACSCWIVNYVEVVAASEPNGSSIEGGEAIGDGEMGSMNEVDK